MKICWNKTIAESSSPVAEAVKRQYGNEINYSYCKRRCRGDNTTCRFYEVREMQPIEEETAEDSSIGRLDDFDCQIPLADGFAVVEERHRVYQGGFGN